MSDWEDELENEEVAPAQEEKKDDFAPAIEESEEIIKTEVVKEKQNDPNSKQIDYEKKYNERNKDAIAAREEIEKAVAGIQDPVLRLKKMKELEDIYHAGKFITGEEDEEKNKQKAMELEKDYIQLAQKSAAKINQAERPTAFTFSYLKTSFDMLLDTLPQAKLNELLKVIAIVFNKKLKEEGNKKKTSNKPTIKSGKDVASYNKKGVIYEDNAGDEDYEEDEYDETVFG